jgi:hypothetical protein
MNLYCGLCTITGLGKPDGRNNREGWITMNAIKILLLFSIVFIFGCQPSEQAIQTAMAQTQAAMPTATQTKILPTVTPLPTNTPIPTATATIVPTPTPDLRVIDIDPRKLVLQKNDLPPSGKYILPDSTWTSPQTNAEITSEWTVEQGKAYIAETGRIHGWWVDYLRNAGEATTPEEIYSQVVLYSKSDGAQLVVTKYDDDYFENGFIEIDAPQVGDVTRAFKKTVNEGGPTVVWLDLDFTYRNVYYNVELYGFENEVSMDLAVDIANKLLSNLKQLPLSDTVTFQP